MTGTMTLTMREVMGTVANNTAAGVPDQGGAEPTPASIDGDAPRGAIQEAEVSAFVRDDFDRDVWSVLGAPIDMTDVPAATAMIEAAARDHRRLSFVTPNVNILVDALRDPDARRRLIDADLSLADGAPLVAMAKALGAPLQRRAAGSDLFDALRARPALGRPLRVFFFGGRDGSAERACAAINADPGGVAAVGWCNPGFGDVQSMSKDETIARINRADPDFVVVSLGAAKGQAWIDANKDKLDAPVISHLGAVVDFAAGAVRRAPTWMARAGLEWAWRIIADPALWKRYARDGGALLALSATRLAPQLVSRRKRSGVGASASTTVDAKGAVVALAGDLVAEDLAPVREALRAAAKSGGDVVLDVAEVGAVDGAFFGQVLMLEKQASRIGKTVRLRRVPSGLKRLFRANAMDYEIDMPEEGAATASAPAAASAS
ncbi:MAG: WecB/TagA/CpsF family glycosyltransferase [Pseudomonadota bacterium]